jgi:ribose transport system substrate-binding protein
MKKMKKISVLIVFFMLFAASSVQAKEFTIGLSLSTLNNPFFVTLKDGAVKEAEAAGIKLIVSDSQDNPATEAKNIEDLIVKKVDALLINPTDSSAIAPSVFKANKAGIPVFTVDRSAKQGEVVAHIASDNIAGGMLAAEFLAKQINYKGQVVELEGIAGSSAAIDRGKGFNQVISQHADIKVVAKQTANFNRAEGLRVFENILQAQPEIAGVFAHNDEMILGAVQAAQAAGRDKDIVFVGFDAVDDAVNAVKAGQLAATVAQQPAVIGQLGVKTAVEFLNGKSVKKDIPVPLSLVSK